MASVAFGAIGRAEAAKLHFGTSERLEKIQDSNVRGQSNEPLYLGFKYSQHSFILPYMMTDDGYILGVVGQNRYYKLTPELTRSLQAQGLLPTPLPVYEIAWYDWVLGHLLWLVLASILLSLLLGWRKSGKAKAALPLVAAGMDHHNAGRLDEAIASYDKAIAISPGADALLLRADAHLQRSEPLKAVADLSQIVKQDAKHALALFRRAAVFFDLGRHEAALADLNRVAAIEKGNPEVLLARGRVHAARGGDQLAIADFSAALAADAGRPDVLAERAGAFERLGELAHAAADRARAQELAQAAGRGG